MSPNPHNGFYEADTTRTLDSGGGNPSCNQGGIAVVAFNGGASPQAGSIAYSENVSPTLKSASSGLRTPCVCEPQCLPSVAMRLRGGCEGGGKGPLLQTERSGTLASNNDQYLFCAATTQPNAEICHDLCPTITASAGNSGNNKPFAAYGVDLQQITSKTNRSTLKEIQPSLCMAGSPHVVHPEIAGTLCASAAGLSRPAGMVSETDLPVAYCLQGNMIGRSDRNGPAGSGINTDVCFSLTGADHHAVAVDCRNLTEHDDVSGTLQAKTTPGYSLNYQNPVRDGYIVRRLTPTECEALMGLPCHYTAYGHDGKEISDSRRYSMLGNSIATPCAAYIIQGILAQYAKEESNWKSK
jgi:DNA (cytosine-5)-methyltransferase 1